jgi:uncharacterized protein (TIGR02271 family)
MKEQEIQNALGKPLYALDGASIGNVAQVYLDDTTGRPDWVTVSSGPEGRENFVPIAEANFSDQGVEVPFSKETILSAPGIDADGHLTPDQEEELYRHYGLTRDQIPEDEGFDDRSQRGEGRDEYAGYETSGTNTDSAMTRSEEQLHVDTERVPAGKARLRKYVVTEQENISVPVSHEKIRVEREPVTEANEAEALQGPELSEAEHEVVLNEERPVVTKETTPVERVRMDVENVTEEEEISEEVRKERIEAEGDDASLRGRGGNRRSQDQ